ncbi:MAG: TonB-dependent receptor [Ignavibacteriales bacterium]|nr:TonB-dependent receptor [Ignavibacteriales bacterium]
MNYRYALLLISLFIVGLSSRQLNAQDAQEETPEQVQASTSKMVEKPLQLNSHIILGPITIKLVNEPLISAIKKVAQIVQLRPVLDYDIIKSDKKINLTLNVTTLPEALDQILQGIDVQYSITESGLLVFRQDEKPQPQPGTVRGVVTDATNNETLIGVNVTIQGTSLGTATDIEGAFRIVGIPARTFMLKVSCIGYETQKKEVDFSKTKDITINIQLKPAVIQGEEVVVTAQMRGQLAAINQQVTSNTIVNVVSEEKIKELPDANAAEAIGRLPGVSIIRSGGEATNVVMRGLSSKFSNITLDGVKIPPTDPNSRDVDLSTMSQGSLSGIELFKTLTPDQDADAIAGTINLVTRKAPSEREIRLDLKGDYNNLMKSANQYDIALRYAERYFDDFLGVQIQGNTEKKIRSKEDVSYGYTYSFNGDTTTALNPNGTNDWNRTTFVVDFTDEIRKRNGGQVIFDVNTPDSGSVKLTGAYNETNRNFMLHNRTYPSGGNNAWQYNYEYTEQTISTINTSVQGKNNLLGLTVDWNASYARSKTETPFDCRLSFTEPGGSGGFTDATKNPPETATIPLADNNFAIATLDSTQFLSLNTNDAEKTFLLNVSKKFSFGDFFSNDTKIGGKYKGKTRSMTNGNLSWNNYKKYVLSTVSGPISVDGTRFEGTQNSAVSLLRFLDQPIQTRNLLGVYSMNPLMNQDALKQWWDLNKNGINPGAAQDYGPNGMVLLNDYSIEEQILSAFLMNTLDVGQFATLVFGVRVESESNDYHGKYSDASVGGTGAVQLLTSPVIDTTAKYSETIWLPSVQVALKPTEFLRLRFAAYRALARPDYNLRLPQFSYNTSTTALVVGNPNLKDTKAWNYEANAQIYSNTIGLISISGFYKVLDDLYHQMRNVNISWADSSALIGIAHTPNTGYHRLDELMAYINMSSWNNNPLIFRQLHTNTSYTANLAYNSPDRSYAWGFELEHQMNFGFIPVAWLKSITLSYNISITRSETNIIINQVVQDSVWHPAARRTPAYFTVLDDHNYLLVTRRSENQPEVYGNAALGYDVSGFSARLSVFYQDKYTRQYSGDGSQDNIVESFTKWDLAFKQVISPVLSVFLNINNLSNSKETRSQVDTFMDWSLPNRAELYGTTVDFGVRVSL